MKMRGRGAHYVMLATTSRVALLLLSLCLVANVRQAVGTRAALSQRLERISLHNSLSLRRNILHSTSSIQSTQLCDLDTSNWLASSEPLVKIAKKKRRQKKLRKTQTLGKPSRKRWFQEKLQIDDNVEDSITVEDDGIDSEVLVGVTSPLIPQSIWDRLTGQEFNVPAAVDRLSQTGLYMATTHKGNAWVEWKPASKETSRATEQGNEDDALNEDNILVFLGHPRQEGMGSHMPFVKTKAIVHFSARELAELLLDSGRVQLYNKFSLGRTDVSIMQKGLDHHGPFGIGETKVVENLAQPPIISKKMLSVTLMHVGPLPPECHKSGYLVVSRALGGKQIEESNQVVRNYVLLGVNLLEDLGDQKCLITTVTHLYSPALPSFLAARFGVKSAIKFAKDIRQLSLVKAS